MRTDRLGERIGGSDDEPHSTDDALTAAGVAPVGLDTNDSERSADVHEQAAMSRAMAKLVPDGYQPMRLGRFVLLEPLGKGGMGIVHAGYDDTLDRRVALKLVSPQRSTSDAARRRLFREAQAMAKLSHPNVVQVFEAGEHEGELFIAMELVAGRTLRAWNREARRGWREILRLFAQIGEGLAAAHDAGVVHRDFKPDNVLIDGNDRPKVADFGLATLDLPLSAADSHSSSGTSHPSGNREELTLTGEVMGTPAYMPLEQFTERRCDAAGDQFSFCVALYESLYGERPFDGDTVADIMRHIANRQHRGAPAKSEVPGWLRAIVLRGLSPKPRERFADMRELLAALADDPVARRRRSIVQLSAMAVVVGSVGIGVYTWQSRPRPCADDQPLGEAWGDDARERIADSLRATGVPWAEDAATRANASIDRWAERWNTGYRDACEATQIRGVQSAEAMDLRMGCLQRARASLVATIDQLATADAKVAENAVPLVDALPRLEVCDDLDTLRLRVPPPDDPQVAAEVERLRHEVAVGFASHLAGRLDAAEAKLREVAALAEGIDYAPLHGEIDTVLAEVLLAQARHGEAEAMFRSALTSALADGNDALAIESAANLVIVLGARETRFAEAQWVGDLALGLAQRRGEPSVLADVYNSLGGVLDHQARYDEAEADFRTALELLQGEYGDDHLEVAVLHENLGTTLMGQGRHEEGLAEHRRALQIREGLLGPDHPMIAIGHSNVGTSLQELGRFEEAESELRHAVDLLVRAYGPNHPDAAMASANLGVVLDELGKHGAAQSEYRRSIAIFERTLGPDHPHVAQGYNNLGTSFEDEGRLVEAEAELRRALVISRRAFGEDHPDVARTHGNLASVLIAMRRYDEALAEARTALEVSQRVLGEDHPDLRYAYRGACEAELERARALDEPNDAARGVARAIELCERAGESGTSLLATARAWADDHSR